MKQPEQFSATLARRGGREGKAKVNLTDQTNSAGLRPAQQGLMKAPYVWGNNLVQTGHKRAHPTDSAPAQQATRR